MKIYKVIYWDMASFVTMRPSEKYFLNQLRAIEWRDDLNARAEMDVASIEEIEVDTSSD